MTDETQPPAVVNDDTQSLQPLPEPAAGPFAVAADRPELRVVGAFAGGWLLATLLKRLVR